MFSICAETPPSGRILIMNIPFCTPTTRRRDMRERERDMKVGLWNVRGLQTEAKMFAVTGVIENHSIDLLFLTETHLHGVSDRQSPELTLLNSGPAANAKCLHGVGFLIRNTHLNCGYSFVGYSSRVARLSLNSGSNYIVCYAPTESGGTEEEIDDFYLLLHRAMAECPPGTEKRIIIGGDFNCRIGEDPEPLRKAVGKWTSTVKTSENGEILIDFCHMNNLRIMNSFFRHKLFQRATWAHPATKRKETLDFFLANEGSFKLFTDVKVETSADCGSDHELLTAKIRQSTLISSQKPKRKQGRSRRRRHDHALITGNAVKFRQRLASNLAGQESGWKYTETAMQKTLSETIPKRKRDRDWYETARPLIAPLMTEQAKAKRCMWANHNDTTRTAYKTAKIAVRRCVRKCKKDYLLSIGKQIERSVEQNDSHATKKLVQKLLQETRNGGDSKIGKVKQAIDDKKLRDHFESVFKSQGDTDEFQNLNIMAAEDMLLNGPPTRAEVQRAITELSNNKTPGTNGIPAEAFKAGGIALLTKLVKDFRDIWPTNGEGANIPQSWREAEVVAIYKGKGSKLDPNCYRGIFLLDVAGKILAKVINNRLTKLSENVISESQFGFRPNRSTAHAIFALRQAQQAARYKNQDLVVAFVDLEKAFDSIPRKAIWQCLKAMGAPPNLVAVIKSFHDGAKGFVGEFEFPMERGVRQGCILGPALFNILFHCVICQAGLTNGMKLRTVPENGILVNGDQTKEFEFLHEEYADDMCLGADNLVELEKGLKKLDEVGRPLGIKINSNKTKVLWLSKSKAENRYGGEVVRLNGSTIEEVKSFCYLGQMINGTGAVSVEIRHRITSARNKLSVMSPVIRCSALSRESKIKLVKCVILPTLLYGCETWNTTSRDEECLSAFLNNCRLRILGKSRLDKIRVEVLELEVKLPKIRTLLASRRLGFLASLYSERAPELPRDMLFAETMDGQRLGGRKIQEWTARLRGDLEWFHQMGRSAAELLEILISSGRDSKTNIGLRKTLKALLCKDIADGQTIQSMRLVGTRVREIKCLMCERMFAVEKEMQRHYRNDHFHGETVQTVIAVDSDKPFRCIVTNCKKVFKTQGWLTRHIRECHTVAANESTIVIQTENVIPTDVIQANVIQQPLALVAAAVQVVGNVSLFFGVTPPFGVGPPIDATPLLGPPWKCPYSGCGKEYGSEKSLVNHGNQIHGWSFRTNLPTRARAKKRASIAKIEAGNGT